jgi:hypothetical protein
MPKDFNSTYPYLKSKKHYGRLAILASCLCSNAISWAKDEKPFVLKPSMQMYLYLSQQSLAESSFNFENSVMLIEDRAATVDLRPSFKLDNGSFQLIARPQMRSSLTSAVVGGKRQTEHATSTAKWLETYGNWNASDNVLVSYGIQNYQWGAAELANPSNQVFHETVDSKGLLQTTQGRQIMRLNVTWIKNLSSIFLSETEPVKNQAVYRYGETFESKSLMKHEVSWNDGADYLGVVFGASETTSPWVGEYLNFTLFDGLTIYGDAAHQKNSYAWYPVVEPGNTTAKTPERVMMSQNKIDEQKTYSTVVGGLRYSFEGGSDMRFEYLYQNAGWNDEELDLAARMVNVQRPEQAAALQNNHGPWQRPGLTYRGQRYALLSLRLPDLFDIKDWIVTVRGMKAAQDDSVAGYLSSEYSFGDASTIFIAGSSANGGNDSLLVGPVRSRIDVGWRQDF